MTLTAGTKLGPYEIQSALGAGGMGEVYRARDNRLGREVALKIVPGNFTRDLTGSAGSIERSPDVVWGWMLLVRMPRPSSKRE